MALKVIAHTIGAGSRHGMTCRRGVRATGLRQGPRPGSAPEEDEEGSHLLGHTLEAELQRQRHHHNHRIKHVPAAARRGGGSPGEGQPTGPRYRPSQPNELPLRAETTLH